MKFKNSLVFFLVIFYITACGGSSSESTNTDFKAGAVNTAIVSSASIVFQINNFPSTGSGNEFPEPVEGNGIEV